MGKRRLIAIADRGYYSSQVLKDCEDAGVAAELPVGGLLLLQATRRRQAHQAPCASRAATTAPA